MWQPGLAAAAAAAAGTVPRGCMVGCSKSSVPAASNLVGGCSEIILVAAALLLVLLLQHRLRPAGDERAGEEGREVTHEGWAAQQ